MTFLAVLLAAVSFAPAASVGVPTPHEHAVASRPITDKQVPPEPTSAAYRAALVRLGVRVTAIEAATVTLVGTPPETTEPSATDPAVAGPTVDPSAVPTPTDPTTVPTPSEPPSIDVTDLVAQVVEPPPTTGSALTVEQLPPRVVDARQQVDGGDLSAASKVVKGVETDVLLVALDLADQSAQNAALARLLVGTDPHVAALDAAVAATHASADGRDVVATATYAAQARDAADGITLAAQQAFTTADDATKAAILLADQQARSTDGYTNGNIPLDVLCVLSFAPQQHLRCDAAAALERMNVAYHQAFGHDMVISDSYRSLVDQVLTKAAKGGLAAEPGTSNHGWGLAIDVGDGVDSYGSAQYAWLKVNAVLFGWHHPTYMDQGGRGPHEPWHWEFGTTDDRGTGTSTPITVDGQPNTATPAAPVEPVAEQPTPSPSPTPDPTPTPTASPTPDPTPTPTPTTTPSPTPSDQPTPSEPATPTPSPGPTDTPTTDPSPTEPVAPTP
ncbi:D-alanyl-D-alanine carboxypeptidase family protein [Cellulomonas sp. McL0617]|uniref:M15 family metallopeptidase n=1 Tax=Cellulomonas sp. McL0617 TaxID=3415675 RepID=UPI003CFAFDDB